jgi:hypothetical protein
MQDITENRQKRMQEALQLQSEWEKALAQITKGRQYDELTEEEMQQYSQVSVNYNERIDRILEEVFPNFLKRNP